MAGDGEIPFDPRSETVFEDLVAVAMSDSEYEISPEIIMLLFEPLQIPGNPALTRASVHLVNTKIWTVLSRELMNYEEDSTCVPLADTDFSDLRDKYQVIVCLADAINQGSQGVSFGQVESVLDSLSASREIFINNQLPERFCLIPPYLALILVSCVDNALEHGNSLRIDIVIKELVDDISILVRDNGYGFDLSSLDDIDILEYDPTEPLRKNGNGTRILVHDILSRGGTVSFRSGKGVGSFHYSDHDQQGVYEYYELEENISGTCVELRIPKANYFFK